MFYSRLDDQQAALPLAHRDDIGLATYDTEAVALAFVLKSTAKPLGGESLAPAVQPALRRLGLWEREERAARCRGVLVGVVQTPFGVCQEEDRHKLPDVNWVGGSRAMWVLSAVVPEVGDQARCS
jgi:hypothetical protein